jgi:hypothetical protein
MPDPAIGEPANYRRKDPRPGEVITDPKECFERTFIRDGVIIDQPDPTHPFFQDPPDAPVAGRRKSQVLAEGQNLDPRLKPSNGIYAVGGRPVVDHRNRDGPDGAPEHRLNAPDGLGRQVVVDDHHPHRNLGRVAAMI